MGLGIVLAAVQAWAQGSLTPPGAPAPTMKTLAQIEPRIPISTNGTVITRSGAYYLTTNLTASAAGAAAIRVLANDVTIDLGGWTIKGTGTGENGGGIMQGTTNANLCILNGVVCNYTGDSEGGIYAPGRNVQVVDVRAISNWYGIVVGSNSIVQGCVAESSIETGISAGPGSTIEKCQATGNGSGIGAGNDSVIRLCLARNNGGGISCAARCLVQDNLCASNSGDNIYAGGAGTRIERNTLVGGGVGLHIANSGNIVADNVVRDNTDNYFVQYGGNELNLLLCQTPETLDWPCNVKFAGSLSNSVANGITVNANNVTIDLNGHALIGPGPGVFLSGISQDTGRHSLVVRNGIVTGWFWGVETSGANNRMEDLRVTTNTVGIMDSGHGIVITRCSASRNVSCGIGCSNHGTITACSSCDNGDRGYDVYSGSTIRDCTASDNGGNGIYAVNDSVIMNNSCLNNGKAGIEVYFYRNRVEANHLTGNQVGLRADGMATANLIVRNSAVNNATNYLIGAGNKSGGISADPSTAGPSANFSW
jgi:parallel beta-helix repeat protein